MPLNLRTNPAGMDWYIQQLQKKLFNNLPNSSYNSYGRAYRNKVDGGYIAEVYAGDNRYTEVYLDNAVALTSWFGVSGPVKTGKQSEVDIHIVFFANLATLALKDYKGNLITHRADGELHQQVLDLIGMSSFGISPVSIETGVDNALREYPGSRRDDRLKAADMHPYHCFRINTTLIFDPNKIC